MIATFFFQALVISIFKKISQYFLIYILMIFYRNTIFSLYLVIAIGTILDQQLLYMIFDRNVCITSIYLRMREG